MSVLSRTTSPNDRPVRRASSRHCTERHDRLSSIARLKDSTMPASPADTALRIAGPITGNSASAMGLGSRLTAAVSAFSSGGVSARAKCGSCARCSRTVGSTSPTSRARASRSSRRAWSAARLSRSGPTRTSRSADRASRSASRSAAVTSPCRSSFPFGLSTAVRRIRREPHGHLVEERGQRRAIRLLGSQIGRLLGQTQQHVVDLLTEIVSQAMARVEDLLTELALHFSDLVVDLTGLLLERFRGVARVAREVFGGVGPFVMLGLDPLGERGRLLLDELLERRQALADVVLELGRLFQQAIFEALKAAIDIPGLPATEDVADFVEIARRSVRERRRLSVRFA